MQCRALLGPFVVLLFFSMVTVVMVWSVPDHALYSPVLASISRSSFRQQHNPDSNSALTPEISAISATEPSELQYAVAENTDKKNDILNKAAAPSAPGPLASTAGDSPARPEIHTPRSQPQPPQPPHTAALAQGSPAGADIASVIKALFDLGAKDPNALLKKLRNEDPLGVQSGPEGFVCPPVTSRVSDGSAVDTDRLARFVAGDPGTWIFYQHLRKAGGTGFCQLATDNLKKGEVPPYYCMIDNRGSLATPPWNDGSYTVREMERRKFRITSNEWDVFYESMFDWPGAIFATTIRDPVDRIYSQYRFEHLEHRDGSAATAPRKSAKEFYLSQKGWTMGENYYLKTFIGDMDKTIAKPKTGDFYWTYHKYQHKRITWEMFSSALKNIMRFHLIFVTEWLEPSSTMLLNKTLHWSVPPKQVLPPEVQAIRKDKKSRGAEASIPADDYMYLLKENILDLLFFRVVQRVYLERLSC